MSDETPTPTPSPAPAPTPSPTSTPTPTPTPAPAAAEWLGSLSDETLRGDETLWRYKSIDDLAKGHLETLRWARGRVPLPAADDAKGREDFVTKARPESWDKYEVSVPEGQGAERADAFKQKAHAIGLMPWQAKELGDWSNAYEADAMSRMTQAAKDELTTREVNVGPAGFVRVNEAIANMFGQVDGVDGFDSAKVMQGLESAFGAGQTWDFLRWVATRTGELEKVDGASVDLRLGSLTPQNAQKKIEQLMGDKDFMAKAAVAGSAEQKQWNDLNKAASGA